LREKEADGVSKYTFWGVIHQHVNVALTEDLSRYAKGETFWQAMLNLIETQPESKASGRDEEVEINARLRMYHETGINRVEIFVSQEAKLYSVRSANTRSRIAAGSEQEAMCQYISTKARTSVVNTGEVLKT
jgi:hypothetical protein